MECSKRTIKFAGVGQRKIIWGEISLIEDAMIDKSFIARFAISASISNINSVSVLIEPLLE